MYTILKGYVSPGTFAKSYTKANGKTGVSRIYIYELIKKEKESPKTTGLDVLEIDGSFYVKQSESKQ